MLPGALRSKIDGCADERSKVVDGVGIGERVDGGGGEQKRRKGVCHG